jgi:hypothetical protein
MTFVAQPSSLAIELESVFLGGGVSMSLASESLETISFAAEMQAILIMENDFRDHCGRQTAKPHA